MSNEGIDREVPPGAEEFRFPVEGAEVAPSPEVTGALKKIRGRTAQIAGIEDSDGESRVGEISGAISASKRKTVQRLIDFFENPSDGVVEK